MNRAMWILAPVCVLATNVGAVFGVIWGLDVRFDSNVFYLLFGFVVGILGGETALAVTWLVFGAQSLAVRMALALCVFLSVMGTWFCGHGLTDYFPPLELNVFIAGFCVVLFGSLIVTMWIAKRWMQSTIRVVGSPATRAARRQFSIRSIMVVTTTVAVFLAIVQTVFANREWGMKIDFDVIRGVSIIVLGFGAYITLIVLPLLRVILREPRASKRWLLLTLSSISGWPYILSETLFRIPGIGPPPPKIYWWVVASPFAFGFAVAMVTSLGFIVFRRLGYRLQPDVLLEPELEQRLSESTVDGQAN